MCVCLMYIYNIHEVYFPLRLSLKAINFLREQSNATLSVIKYTIYVVTVKHNYLLCL